MADPSVLAQLGLHLPDLVGGAAGGTVAGAIVFKRGDPIAFLGYVLVGSLTAGYLTNWLTAYVGNFAGGVSFVVGLGSMGICKSLQTFVVWKLPNAKGPTT